MSPDPSSQIARTRRWGRASLRLIGPAIFVLLIAFVVDVGALVGIIRDSDPLLFVAGVLLIQVGIVLRGVRWMWLHRICGLDPGRLLYQLRLSFAAGFAAQLVPSPASPFSRLVLLTQDGHAPGRALAALVLEKIADVAMFVLFGIFGAVYLSAVSAARLGEAVAALFVAGMAVWLARRPLRALGYRIVARIRSRIGAATLAELGATLRATSPSRLGAVVAISIVIALIQAAVTVVMARALGITASAGFIVAVWGIVALTVLVPFSINGIGMREGVYVAALATVGVSRDRAFALSLLVLAAAFVGATPGAIEWLVRLAFPRLSRILAPTTPPATLSPQPLLDQPADPRASEHH